MRSPSRPTHTGTLWGEPSGITVARCAKLGRSSSCLISAESGWAMVSWHLLFAVAECGQSTRGHVGRRPLRAVPMKQMAVIVALASEVADGRHDLAAHARERLEHPGVIARDVAHHHVLE